MPRRHAAVFALPLALLAALAHADGPADNLADNVRPVPPPGIAVPDDVRQELQAGIDALSKEIAELPKALAGKPALLDLMPDVEIFHNAIRFALAYGEFYDAKEFETARAQLQAGHERALQLREGKAPWATAAGLVVRGYRSKIDGSAQPYGLVVPPSFRADSPFKHRLDLWCHGRGEKLTELAFLRDRQRSPGEFTPHDAFVLHLYGRYCNANKFAGEVDCLEALAHARAHYPVDENRVVMRGFSMGGAACWQFAVHFPTLWAAAAPGAGFAETADFLKVFQKEAVQPARYEQKLYHLYDCTDYAANLFNCPTVAYSGEVDSQKQAADVMAAAMRKEGLSLTHVIGPKTGHAYHPAAKREVNLRIDAIADRGRDPLPRHVRFTTYTLRYPESAWVRVEGLGKHWEKANVNAEILDAHTVRVVTGNVTALTLSMPSGRCPLENGDGSGPAVRIDDTPAPTVPGVPLVQSDRSWEIHLQRGEGGKWKAVDRIDDGTLRKRPGLQGPIDDAFFDSFLMVRPTGAPRHEPTRSWAEAEMKHAVDHWRKQFRGEARVKADAEVTEADIATHNLVLWGDPGSNKVLARIAEKLPVRWAADGIHVGKQTFDAGHHVPALIYLNPLNPKRYVVLNSGFTFREYDYLNNARQVPKLPDYAVFDVRSPRTSRAAGKVVAAGFFDEAWQLPAAGE